MNYGHGFGVYLPMGGVPAWTPEELSSVVLWLRPEELDNPNRLLYTEDLSDAAWTTSDLTETGGHTDPNGGSTAWQLQASDAAARFASQDAQGYISGGEETISFWIKRGAGHDGTSASRFRFWDGVTGQDYDVVPTTAWQKLTYTRTMDGSSDKVNVNFYPDITTNQNPVLYWHPQLEAGDTATTYVANTATAGGIVASWEDQSGNSNNAEQATQSQMPLVEADVFDGHNGALFDGVDDLLNLVSGIAVNSDFEAWTVVRHDNAFAVVLANKLQSVEYIGFGTSNPGPLSFRTTAASTTVTGNEFPVGTHFLGRLKRNSADNVFAEENGLDVTSGSPSNSGDMTINRVGGRASNASPWGGTMLEIIVLSSEATYGEQYQLLNYLKIKYPSLGITVPSETPSYDWDQLGNTYLAYNAQNVTGDPVTAMTKIAGTYASTLTPPGTGPAISPTTYNSLAAVRFTAQSEKCWLGATIDFAGDFTIIMMATPNQAVTGSPRMLNQEGVTDHVRWATGTGGLGGWYANNGTDNPGTGNNVITPGSMDILVVRRIGSTMEAIRNGVVDGTDATSSVGMTINTLGYSAESFDWLEWAMYDSQGLSNEALNTMGAMLDEKYGTSLWTPMA